MKNIRGTRAFWNSVKLDLLAMIKTLGPPTFFITLSANDMYWDDLVTVLCKQAGLPNSPSYISQLSRSERENLMTKGPVATAHHFSHRVHHFVQHVLLSAQSPIGVVRDYFWRVEFQMRGSPHLHGLFWVADAPEV